MPEKVDASMEFTKQIRGIVERTAAKYKARNTTRQTDDARLKQAAADVLSMSSLLKDQRYEAMARFIEQLTIDLNKRMQSILIGDAFTDREQRADRAAIVAAQIDLLQLLLNQPHRVIDRLGK